MKTVKLKRGKEKLLQRRHPWIFSGALAFQEEKPENGELVQVFDFRDRLLAVGHYYNSSIAIRILRFDEGLIDLAFFTGKIRKALELREALGLVQNDENSVYRLVNAEGDGLPGLVVDWYNGVAVVSTSSAGMKLQEDLIVSALKEVLGESLKAIYSRDEEKKGKYLFGKGITPHPVREYGHQFLVDWEAGQKTGFFIDQRENRKKTAAYARNRKVLNAFSYTGGFSVYALHGGAAQLDSVDSSGPAIDLAIKNVELNKLAENHRGIEADVFDYMKDHKNEYDMIIADPPAFARSISRRHNAVIGYKRLNTLAMSSIRAGGILFTFSCSQVVDTRLFEDTVRAAAIESGRSIQILERLSQPADHPVSIYHPEGNYLKGLILKVD